MNSLNNDAGKESQSTREKRQKPDSLTEGDAIESGQSVESEAEDISPSFYRGFRLDAKAIVKKADSDVLSLFTERSRTVTGKDARKRLFFNCLICSEHEEEAKHFAINHKINMAQGVRYDGQKKLKYVINHVHGAPHEAAMERAKLKQQWNSEDSNNAWLRTMKSNDPAVINTLVHTAIDVYNDSKLLTSVA